MLEVARYEAERRLRGTLAVAGGLVAYGLLFVAIAPGILAEVDIEAYADQLPPALVESFGLDAIGTLEGFLAAELYTVGWLLALGIYVAYSAAGSVAGDVESDRMDLLLAAPVSRTRLLLETALSLALPVLVVNAAVAAAVYAGSVLLADPLPVVPLLAVHALSVPYLAFCAALGMLCSVAAPRRRIAEGVAAGVLVATFLLETVTAATDVAWVGAVAPARYYHPVRVLARSQYDLAGAGVLLAAAAVLLAAATLRFRRMDIT